MAALRGVDKFNVYAKLEWHGETPTVHICKHFALINIYLCNQSEAIISQSNDQNLMGVM